MRTEPQILLDDYNRWRLQTGALEARRQSGQFVRSFKETPERLQLFTDMAIWCRTHKIDPRLWIYLLFRARAWTFAPQLLPGHLMSKKMLTRYPGLAEKALTGYRYHIQDAYATEAPFDPNWELSSGTEMLKSRYQALGDHQRCMRETVDRTMGFHPKSTPCQSCPIRRQCAEQLQKLIPEFDIVALRNGDITVEQAKASVHG